MILSRQKPDSCVTELKGECTVLAQWPLIVVAFVDADSWSAQAFQGRDEAVSFPTSRSTGWGFAELVQSAK